jgi:hypothetical protein
MNNQSLGAVFIGLGVLLIALGALFLAGQAVGFDLGHFGWPFFFIIPGLAVFGIGLAAGGPTGERMTPLGAAVTMTGLILLYQNAADHFESWAYAWALAFPTAIGLGHTIYGLLKERKDMVVDEQDAFRDLLNRFVRTYSFLSQVVSFTDAGL